MPVPRPSTAVHLHAVPAAALVLPVFAVPTVAGYRPRLKVVLVPGRSAPAVLWLRPGIPREVVAELLCDLGPDAADWFELMAVGGPGRWTLVRATVGAAIPLWTNGFTESAVERLYLPTGRQLCPRVPRSLAPSAGHLSWLMNDGRLVVNTTELAFRPLADWWAATVPPVRHLDALVVASPFDPFTPLLATPTRPDGTPPVRPLPVTRPTPQPTPRRRLRATLPRLVAALAPATPMAVVPSDLRLLEGKLVAEPATRDAVEQAALWAELAGGYRAAGRPADAAVCWVNAVWCHPAPPTDWLRRWRSAEIVAGSSPARLAAAAVASDPDAPVVEAIRLLDTREAEVPARAVWLARLALERHTGDPLGLARCRDRLLARLAAGPELDLDVPGFLRRSDRHADPDAVWAWLTAIADPVRKWLATCTATTKLTAAGLDADRAATRCYAELIRAWGSATVGDRSALGRATTAAAELRALRRPAGTDPAVHRILGDRLLSRVRSALTGQPSEGSASEPAADCLAPLDRYAVERLRTGCESLGTREDDPPLDTPTGRVIAAANAARSAHRPEAVLALLATLDPTDAFAAAGPLFRSAHALGLVGELAGLVAAMSALRPPPGGQRDLGLAVGRYLTGDAAGGDQALDVARDRLFVTGVADPRKRGELAVAYAAAVGHTTPGLVLGRLDELFRRLGPVSAQGACGRYFALLPLRVVDAAVRAAVGDDFAPTAAVRRWLADEEWQTRRRIHRDMRKVLGATDDPRDGADDRR